MKKGENTVDLQLLVAQAMIYTDQSVFDERLTVRNMKEMSRCQDRAPERPFYGSRADRPRWLSSQDTLGMGLIFYYYYYFLTI